MFNAVVFYLCSSRKFWKGKRRAIQTAKPNLASYSREELRTEATHGRRKRAENSMTFTSQSLWFDLVIKGLCTWNRKSRRSYYNVMSSERSDLYLQIGIREELLEHLWCPCPARKKHRGARNSLDGSICRILDGDTGEFAVRVLADRYRRCGVMEGHSLRHGPIDEILT